MTKLAGPLAALALLALSAPAQAADASEHELGGRWMYWSLMAGTMQSDEHWTDPYDGTDFNGAFGFSAILGGFVYTEGNVSMGKGEGGFYFLDLFNYDLGFGLPIPLQDGDDRYFLFVGASPFALFWVSPGSEMGLSTHAKLQLGDVLVEAKAIPVSYLEGSDVSGANMPHSLGLHYWFADWWSLGVRYDSYDAETSNTSLAFHFVP